MAALAREHAAFSPPFARWVQWRLAQHAHAYQLWRLHTHPGTSDVMHLRSGSLLARVRALYGDESVASDRRAGRELLGLYVDLFREQEQVGDPGGVSLLFSNNW